MKVERITTGSGSRIEPPLDERWTGLQKLEWLCAVVGVDHGLDVSVYDSESATRVLGIWVRDWRTRYGYRVGGVSGGAYTFSEMWSVLSALGVGYSAGLKAVES